MARNKDLLRKARAAALVPVAVVSVGITVRELGGGQVVSLADAGLTTPTSSLTPTPAAAPVPPTVTPPAEAYQPPATISKPQGQAAAPATISPRETTAIVASASNSAIPPVALAAYQRAATIVDAADASCHLDWQLLAAIGRIESDHGTTGGSQLSATGIATPAIYGPVLDGTHGTRRIADTDGGAYDGSTTYDRAVGPMQFLPSTWVLVGVDADGDGKRDPQDINDASLAAAVYLCSGKADLATATAQQAAALRYNHSASYAATVLAIAQAYRQGDYTTPVSDLPAVYVAATTLGTTPASAPSVRQHRKGRAVKETESLKAVPPATAKPSAPAQQTLVTGPGAPVTKPVTAPVAPPTAPVAAPPTTPAPQPATDDQLTALCQTQLSQAYPQATAEAITTATGECVTALQGLTLDDATAQAADVVAGLASKVDGLVPPAPTEPTEPTEPTSPTAPVTPPVTSTPVTTP